MKTKLKLFLITTLVLTGALSLFFFSDTKVSAQAARDTIKVETTGYSVLSASSFVFGGFYSGNLDKKGFTTYFEFKKNDNNLDDSNNREETIKIVRDSNVEEYNDFYSSPELKLFSDYFFRAVGYFNDNPDKKYYGETLYMRTGYIPVGMTYPFSVDKNNSYKKYVPPVCKTNQVLVNGVCKDKVANANDNNNASGSTTGNTGNVNNNNNASGSGNANTSNTKTNDNNTGLVPCDNSAGNPCDFPKLFDLINTVINFVFKNLVLPLAAIMFAYAGFELVTSGGSTEKKSKAKSIFLNVAIGLIVAAAAFLIIQTILSIVGARTDIGINWFGFLK